MSFTAILHKEEGIYIARCAEVGTVSQDKTIEGAIKNLKEATALYLEEFPIREEDKPIMTVFDIKHAKTTKTIRA